MNPKCPWVYTRDTKVKRSGISRGRGHLVVMDTQERTELTSHVCSSDGVDIGNPGEVKQVAARLIGHDTGADWFPRQRTGVGVGMAAFILAGGLEQKATDHANNYMHIILPCGGSTIVPPSKGCLYSLDWTGSWIGLHNLSLHSYLDSIQHVTAIAKVGFLGATCSSATFTCSYHTHSFAAVEIYQRL